MKLVRILLFVVLCRTWLPGEVLNNDSLNGDYHFVHLLASVAPAGSATNAENLSGTITFDGNGAFTFSGSLGSGGGTPGPVSGNGAYSVAPSGFVMLDNPNPNVNLQINARLGDAGEVLLGASTEATDGSIDFFAAVRAPTTPVDDAVLTGEYTGAGLAFLEGSDSFLTSTLLTFSSAGTGIIPNVEVIGHAFDVARDVGLREMIINAPYTINGQGVGTAELGRGFGDGSGLFFGVHDIFVSATGNYVIGSSREEDGRQIFVAIKRFSGNAKGAEWDGDYWTAGIDIDLAQPTRTFTSSAGALRSFFRDGEGTVSAAARVYRMSPATPPTGFSFDASGTNPYRIDDDRRGYLGQSENQQEINMAIGAAGGGAPRAFVGAHVTVPGETTSRHGIFFGVRLPSLSGPGVFLNPLGVVNGASFAPPAFPIAPGTIVSLFGTGLAPLGTDASAQSIPLPTALAGVSVSVDGVLAPLFSVRPGQINIQVPFAVEGPTATIRVNNNGAPSNPVEVNVAAASPGIFAVDATGTGRGVITHADFRLVTEENPAVPGEIVIIFLTGLGAVEPPVPDGSAGPIEPLSRAVDAENIKVRFNRDFTGEVRYAGIAPNFVGLYQINVTIPNEPGLSGLVSVSIETSSATSRFIHIDMAP